MRPKVRSTLSDYKRCMLSPRDYGGKAIFKIIGFFSESAFIQNPSKISHSANISRFIVYLICYTIPEDHMSAEIW